MTAADPNVRAAIAHWAPRLIANGIDYNDFQATTARISRWPDWCAEWMATAARHEALAAEAEARGSPVSAAEAHVRAALCHHFGKFVFFEDRALYRAASAAVARNYARALTHLDPPAERAEIAYRGTALPAYLRRPKGVGRPPVVVIVSGLDSVKEEAHAFEAAFHRRGMATLAFDGPGQGESEALPIEPAFEKPIAAILDWLEGRADLDGARVGAVGVSLGGYYVARAAAYEKRLKAVAPIGGPFDFGRVLPTMPEISQQAFQFRSHSPDRETAHARARLLTLAGAAALIEAPLLVVFGRKDRLIPPSEAEELHARAGARDKRLQMYEEGGHVCNNVPYAYRPLVADWMAEKLAA